MVMFVLYRYLYDQLGVAKIGIWSLIIAATSVSRIGELGLSAGVVRFVAQSMGEKDHLRAIEIIQTVLITLALAMGLILLVGKPVLEYALPYLLPQEAVAIALGILPVALVSLWLMVITSVISGSLDGCLRIDLRSMLTASSQVVYLTGTILLVPRFGLLGVAFAQLGQYIFLTLSLWFALRRQLTALPLIPVTWRLSALKEIFSYGVRFQVITIVNMLFDPMVKVMISKFGGLESLGVYEIANNLVLRCRAIIIEASRVLVPTIASLQASEKAQARLIFTKAYSLNFYVVILLFGLLCISASTISILWLGHLQNTFVLFVLLLSLGWISNTIIGPSYFSNLGSGRLRENMFSHIITTVVGGVVGMVLGWSFSATGVVAGMLIGLFAGGIFLLIMHMRHLEIHWQTTIVPTGLLSIAASAIILTAVSNYGVSSQPELWVHLITAIVCGVILIGIMSMHPSRTVLMKFRSR